MSSSELAAGGIAVALTRSRRRRWLREPLLLFLLVGALLFGVYRWLHPETGTRENINRIAITEDDLRQMSVGWMAQGRPPPAPEQWRSLVETRVREEVLYREALALGLDRDDTIVKRRLAQKMEFLAEDISNLSEPEPGELKMWFAKNADRFALPPRASFRHVYFSPDHRGKSARADAERVLLRLAGKSSDAPSVASSGDPFMFQDYYGDRSSEQVAAQFGPQFARVLFEEKPGAWRGPIESGYGWHLVFVDSITPGRVPALEEIESDVKAAWIADRREETRRKMYDVMRARYEVVLPDPKGRAVAAPSVEKNPQQE